MASRELLSQIAQLLRPLRMRIAGIAARGVVHIANDAKKLQMLQIAVLADEVVDDAEHHQPYGFTSVPLEGAEVVVIFPNGDRSHPLVVAASDRRFRPAAKQPGEVTMYNNVGASLTMTKDGDIVGTPAPGRRFLVDDGAGGTEPVVKRSEFLSHGHATAATGPVSPPIVAPSSTPSVTFPGTTIFQAK